MTLSTLNYINGIFGLVFVLITIFLGFKIIIRYLKIKDINLLLVGLFIMLISCGWYGTSISFVVAVITGGDGLSYELILLFNFIPLPFAIFFWMTAFTNFLYKKKQKLILSGFMTYVIIVLLIFLYFLFTNSKLIGEKISPVDTKTDNILLIILLISVLLTLLITGLKFAIETLRINNTETKLKGKLLLLAFPSYFVGGILDASITTTAITLIVFRSILITSAVLFYGAFVLPNWMKKFLIKKK